MRGNIQELKLEPLVSGEQGVVYLFARYWSIIPEFKNDIRKLDDVGIEFPDCLYYNHQGKLGGIEFEHRLSGFREHFKIKPRKINGKKKKISGLKLFYDEYTPKAKLLIIYWIEDDDMNSLKKEFTKIVSRSDIEFVNLSEQFFPFIEKDDYNLNAYWKFNKKQKEFFKIKEILNKCKKIKDISVLPEPKSSSPIKLMGFNKKKANNVEYPHWKLIKFFTTGSENGKKKIIDKSNPPKKIFLIPTGSKTIKAGFIVKKVFTINNRIKKKNKLLLKEFFKKNYFWPYDDEYKNSYCIIYLKFNVIDKKKGRDLFNKIVGKNKVISIWSPSGTIIKRDEYPTLYKELDELLH